MKKREYILLIGLILLACSMVYSSDLDVKWIGNITITPAAPMAGNSVKIEGTFRATWAAVDNLRITGGIDRTTIYDRTFPHIDQGVNTDIFFNWIATSGNHTAWFTIDPDNTSGDANVTNNNINKAFIVSVKLTKMPEKIIITTPPPLAKPDLIIQSLENITSTPHVQDMATVRITVKNIGTAKSPNGLANYSLVRQEGKQLAAMDWFYTRKLDVNETFVYEKSFKFFKDAGAGIYEFTSTIDIYKEIIEMNEDNNTKKIEFTVIP